MEGNRSLRNFILSSVLFAILAKHPCECELLKDLEAELDLLTEKYISLSLNREAGVLSRDKR